MAKRARRVDAALHLELRQDRLRRAIRARATVLGTRVKYTRSAALRISARVPAIVERVIAALGELNAREATVVERAEHGAGHVRALRERGVDGRAVEHVRSVLRAHRRERRVDRRGDVIA